MPSDIPSRRVHIIFQPGRRQAALSLARLFPKRIKERMQIFHPTRLCECEWGWDGDGDSILRTYKKTWVVWLFSLFWAFERGAEGYGFFRSVIIPLSTRSIKRTPRS